MTTLRRCRSCTSGWLAHDAGDQCARCRRHARATGKIANRLVALIDWADEGGGAYYRDLSTNLIRLACTPPDGPPRSSRELLARLDKTGLLWAGRPEAQEVERFRDEHIDACRQRYRSFDATDGQLDGSWAPPPRNPSQALRGAADTPRPRGAER